ncbi:MAG TPA: phosphoribosylglycinamide formyltransferase [Chitinophagaceae bacterium]|nr:phosphoribosylglycinamide formyltransferase [Chitinophagaceae bacterium]
MTFRKDKKHIAIFASGMGSNAQKIINHFASRDKNAKVALIVCNNPNAGVLKISKKENIPSLIIERGKFTEDGYVNELKKYEIDLIILAGFLWKVPGALIQSYANKIINIHPALLPKFGGKGMFGNRVHEEVINSKEKESGITIHYVDEIYDHGKIIFQVKCKVEENDTPEILAKKIHTLEHTHYPIIIERIFTSLSPETTDE